MASAWLRGARHAAAIWSRSQGVAAGGTAAAAAAGCAAAGFLKSSRTFSEECPEYRPPAQLGRSFSSIRSPPADENGKLAWAIKQQEVEQVKEILCKDPHKATLLDVDGNTLFHLAAENPNVQPQRAKQLMEPLFTAGWEVVDSKNGQGLRAEQVAAKTSPNGPVDDLLSKRSRSYFEPLRMEKPLDLLGELSPMSWQWEYLVQDEQRRCWAGVLRDSFDEEKLRSLMDTCINKGDWIQPKGVPRKTIWYVDPDFSDCPYRYSGLEYPATVFPPWMIELRSEICERCGLKPGEEPNSCNINIYEDHQHEVGWHSDDEVYFQSLTHDCRIISFSLGAYRDFCWRFQGTRPTEAPGTMGSVPLGDGDVMTMEGLFQKHYKHSVPVGTPPCGPRINMTFRWIRAKAHASDAGIKGVPAKL